MTKPYVIEPSNASTREDATEAGGGHEAPIEQVHRPRIGASIMAKLDEILEHVKGDEGEAGQHAPEGTPEVTFEPEPTQLPTTTTLEEEHEDGDEGEGDEEPKANTPKIAERQPFAFPGRRYARNRDI
jgi:hypothetical protein